MFTVQNLEIKAKLSIKIIHIFNMQRMSLLISISKCISYYLYEVGFITVQVTIIITYVKRQVNIILMSFKILFKKYAKYFNTCTFSDGITL